MDTAQKARELLAEIDRQILDAEKSLKALRAQRSGIAKLVNILGAKAGRPRGMRGRPRGKRTRTDWNKVIASFKGAFSINDLVRASKKAKPTVNQAIQNLKNAGKIKSTGKRGEYQRAGATPAMPKAKAAKKKVAKKKATTKKVPKKKAAPKQASVTPVEKKEGEGKEG